MKQYFANCTTLDQAKAEYKKLAFILHPDTSGFNSKEQFQDMQNQFAAFKPKTEKFKGEEAGHSAENYMSIIQDLMQFEGLIIEICGSFIWLSGNTKEHKEAIKELRNESFKNAAWSSTKLKWFFAPADYKRFSKKSLTMDEIRNKYGSEEVHANQRAKIN